MMQVPTLCMVIDNATSSFSMTPPSEVVSQAIEEAMNLYREAVTNAKPVTPQNSGKAQDDMEENSAIYEVKDCPTAFNLLGGPKIRLIKATVLPPAIGHEPNISDFNEQDFDDRHIETYRCTGSDSSCDSDDQAASLVHHVTKHAYY